LTGLKAKRQLSVSREEVEQSFRGRGRNLRLRENVLRGMYPLEETKANDGEN
jgi:hypothetical protein